MGEVFRELNESTKNKKARRLEEAQPLAKHFTKHTEYHYSTTLNGQRLDWWPSTSRWQYKNEVIYGGVKELLGFLKKRGWDIAKESVSLPHKETMLPDRETMSPHQRHLNAFAMEEAEDEYLKSKGLHCPYPDCLSHEISAQGQAQIDSGGAAELRCSFQENLCHTCNRSWTDLYNLIGVDFHDWQ